MKIRNSLLTAILLWLSWPMMSMSALLFISFIPLLFIEDELFESKNPGTIRKLFSYCFLSFGLWNLACSYWIWNASGVGMVVAVLLNGFLMSLPFCFFHKLRNYVSHKIAFIGFCTAWISMEYFHLQWDLSWPWFTLGNGFASNINWVQWYEFTGVFGGSLWILAINGLLFFSIKKIAQGNSKNFVQTIKHFALAISIIIIPIVFSLIRYYTYTEKIKPCKTIVVQPNIDPYHDKFSNMTMNDQVQRLIHLSDSIGKKDTEFFIWPETALSESIEETQFEQNQSIFNIHQFLNNYKNAVVLTGADTYRQYSERETATARNFNNGQCCYDVFNTGLLIENGTAIQQYHKSKLVAGVEQMPYPKLFKFLEPFALKLGGTFGSLGKENEPIVFYSRSGIGVAPLICYESIYGAYCGQYVKKGAQFIAIITNDGWWGNTPGFRQHNEYAKLRAIETRRCIARSANTGISSFINQRGDILQKSEWWVQGALAQEINLNEEITFYVTYGDWIAKIALSLFLFSILFFCYKKLF